jgi:hypothetical protein
MTTQKLPIDNSLPPPSSSILTCTYCSAEAVSWRGVIVQPPVCAVHYDLLVLVEYMESHNEPITLENVTSRLAWALNNGGNWALTAAQLPELLPVFLQKNSQRTAKHAGHSHTSALEGVK